jgi:signal transduction histidine kinase
MNTHLQHILNFIERDEKLSAEQKSELIKSLKDVDKELEITAFKLDRTEKVKKTTAILLEETIEELEQKRKAVEAQNRDLEIEASLERVRTCATAMNKPEDMLSICRVIFQQLEYLGVKNIRNVQTVILNDPQEYYTNYEYFNLYDKESIIDVPYAAHPIITDFISQIRTSDDYFFFSKIEGETLTDWRQYLKTGQEKVDPRLESASALYYYIYSIGPGALGVSTYDTPMPDEDVVVLKRFRNVFQLAYRRYLDIEQAEAQAREAQIELALERIRARTMAMQRSEELSETAHILFQQFTELGESPLQITIGIVHEDEGFIEFRVTDWAGGGLQVDRGFNASIHEPTLIQKMFIAWKAQQKSLVVDLSGKELEDWIHYRNSISGVTVNSTDTQGRRVVTSAFFSKGHLTFSTPEPPTSETIKILERFAVVFDQTYTRFLDLQKAEAQTRESQIEASLERVRSKAMAMHKSEDLNPAVATVFEELEKLSPGMSRCGIGILDKENRSANAWITSINNEGATVQISGDEPIDVHPLLLGAFNAWVKQEDFSYVLRGKDMVQYYKTSGTGNVRLPESQLIFSEDELKEQHYHFASFQSGGLFAFRDTVFPEEVKTVMKRFAGVFDLTYKRFLDLQKAEAQAREAQIEASLERVRAHAMAMHSSEDLATTVDSFFIELKSLHVIPRRCGVSLIDAETHMANVTFTTLTEAGETKKITGKLSLTGHTLLEGVYNHWKAQKEFHPVLRGDEIKAYYQVINPQVTFPAFGHDAIQYGHYFFFKEGAVFAWTDIELKEEELQIFRKFTSVLSLTYRRYLDLIDAESQAREAIIDAALEKVRGKAMTMQSSKDVTTTAGMVFTELRKLGITPIRTGIGLLNKENRLATVYAGTQSEEGDALSLSGTILLDHHPEFIAQYDCWVRQEDYFPILPKESVRDYYDHLSANFNVPVIGGDMDQYGFFLPFTAGFLFGWSEKPYTSAEINLLNRFKSIIDLTFRRYLDLQKSEANARDAVRQASLDRVRAEIASMRTTKDLEKITPLIWNELTILGVPFIRCGVFIMDDEQQLIHTFLSTPEGKAIAAFHLPYASPGNIAQVLTNWKKNENYIDHWDEAAFIDFAEVLVKEGALTSPEKYLSTMPAGGFYLHFLPFLQGMFYVGNTVQLNEDEMKLIQSVADAFSTAYARYEDFNKLESAKQQVENTLSELKQAQQQLIQSEKMASLGELTAGIAHEIQNPLNFVNNFSEVNAELIEEMKQEIAKENLNEVIAIANDIKDNQEKITHHGKRADAIVKGMLQHSRSSSGQKEPTDINALADEYLRLAYHGLRAKDKTFNATMKTDFDPSIGLINIVPQDIGRVILNLITNAFYVVTEKKKQQPEGYEPTVSVNTKQSGSQVLIVVRDNGNGIPSNVMDKIFQPFFTTKPTGQGTGLGLSLSYDIVKAHGGELKVDTKEGEGAEFIILLPVT